MELRMENRLLTTFSFSSLTGIVLLVLIFFVLSSSVAVQPGIRVQLPRAEATETNGDRGVTITLTAKGQIFVNANSVTKQNLGQALSSALRKSTNQIIIVNADRKVSLESAVRVMDVARAAGATRFMIATQPTVDR